MKLRPFVGSQKSQTHTQEIPNILWNLKFHYHVHNSLPLASILGQMNSVHTTPSYFSKVHFNIIPPHLSRNS
jgi:hypothetical protein